MQLAGTTTWGLTAGESANSALLAHTPLLLAVRLGFPCGTFVCPPLPPCPFTPAGVKGSWNSQFGFFGPDRGVDARGCGTRLAAGIGERCSRSEWIGALAWRDSYARFTRCTASTNELAHLPQYNRSHLTPARMCKVSEANERTRPSKPLGRAEQRSGDRIRAGACLSVASLRTTPGDASSARQPVGPRPLARLFFGYFLLAKQRK